MPKYLFNPIGSSQEWRVQTKTKQNTLNTNQCKYDKILKIINQLFHFLYFVQLFVLFGVTKWHI